MLSLFQTHYRYNVLMTSKRIFPQSDSLRNIFFFSRGIRHSCNVVVNYGFRAESLSCFVAQNDVIPFSLSKLITCQRSAKMFFINS